MIVIAILIVLRLMIIVTVDRLLEVIVIKNLIILVSNRKTKDGKEDKIDHHRLTRLDRQFLMVKIKREANKINECFIERL